MYLFVSACCLSSFESLDILEISVSSSLFISPLKSSLFLLSLLPRILLSCSRSVSRIIDHLSSSSTSSLGPNRN